MNTQKTQQRNLKSSTEKIVNLSEGLLITGMHRSGTSMIAGLVEKYGVNQLGKNPMNAGADNRDGFHEDIALVKISDDILQLSESSWDVPSIAAKSHSQRDNLAESLIQAARREVFHLRQDVGEPWFIKDPRICLTLNEWRRILLLRIPMIFIVRNPHDVASSLMQRNAMDPRRALALWYRYNSALLRSVDRNQILVLDYDLTCRGPGAAQAAVEAFLETFLSRGDNYKFESETQVIFNPRNFSRSIDFSDAKLSKESKDCFDLYRKISLFHLKTRLTTLKLLAEPSWVEEELNIAHREAFTQSQLTELDKKNEYLFTELGKTRDLAAERDNQLNQLRAETEQERITLETQLTELDKKNEYLFTELGKTRDLAAERDTELNQYIREIRGKISHFDRESTRMSISLSDALFRNQDLQQFVRRAEVLEAYLALVIEDCRRLTSKSIYRIARKAKIIFKVLFGYFLDNKPLKNDVLPIDRTATEIISEVIALDFQTQQYLLLHPDLKKSGINPISHYILHGKNEGRQLPAKLN
jgi:hypothetical protein